VIAGLALPGSAQAAGPTKLSTQIARTEVALWRCQDQRQVARTAASVDPWSLPSSRAYRGWVLKRWQARLSDCLDVLHQRTIPTTNDWQTAVALVQRIYPGTSGWLLYISHREGGHGAFVMNHQGSGAGGWMQFMSGTYYGYARAAYADVARRGFIVDRRTNSWYHPLGQAIVAGFMRFTGRDGCHWCL
jgi:hypothetical protein